MYWANSCKDISGFASFLIINLFQKWTMYIYLFPLLISSWHMICKLQKKVHLWYIKGLKITNTWNVGERGEWDSGKIVGTWDSLQLQFFYHFFYEYNYYCDCDYDWIKFENEEQDNDFDMIVATTVLQWRLQGSKWLWLFSLMLAAPQVGGRGARQRGWAAVWTQFPEKESAKRTNFLGMTSSNKT